MLVQLCDISHLQTCTATGLRYAKRMMDDANCEGDARTIMVHFNNHADKPDVILQALSSLRELVALGTHFWLIAMRLT